MLNLIKLYHIYWKKMPQIGARNCLITLGESTSLKENIGAIS